MTTHGSRPLRALVLHSGNLFGGIETALVSLARGCARPLAGLEPSFALCFDQGRVAGELRNAGATVHPLGDTRISRVWQVRRARMRLRRLLAESAFDVCVMPSTWTHALFASVVRDCGLPIVVWAHDRWTRERWLDRLALRHRPDMVIANSRYTADGMRQVLPDVLARVVYYAIADAPVAPDRRAEIRAQLDAPGDAVVIVQVGRLDPYKGHRVLLDALARLPRIIEWRCWVVGGADTDLQRNYLAELKRAAAHSGIAPRVAFTGARADIGSVLAAADIFCHPNVAPEPFGIVFIEALRAGLPVVGSASGGVLDIVDDSCGRLVPSGDAGALSAVLGELLESRDVRARLGAAGPHRAATLCGLDAQIAEFTRVLSRVVPSTVLRAGCDSAPSAAAVTH